MARSLAVFKSGYVLVQKCALGLVETAFLRCASEATIATKMNTLKQFQTPVLGQLPSFQGDVL